MIREDPVQIGRLVSAMHQWAVRTVVATIVCGFLASGVGCDRRAGSSPDGGTVIRVEGSDTMVNVAQAWAETYHQKHPEVSVQVLGGGSGVGIASLIDGNCDMANSSRKIKADEIQKVAAAHGAKPKEIVVGYDALAVYVHKDNPLESISLEELAEIYGGDGSDHPVVATRQRAPLGRSRHDRPRQPAEQLRDLRLFPRGRAGQEARLQARLGRPERLEGRGRAGVQDAQRHRLQRDGLPDARGQDAAGRQARRASRA